MKLEDIGVRKDELSPEDKERLERMLANSKRELKSYSKNQLITMIQELAIKNSILENVVNNALEAQNKKEANEGLTSSPNTSS